MSPWLKSTTRPLSAPALGPMFRLRLMPLPLSVSPGTPSKPAEPAPACRPTKLAWVLGSCIRARPKLASCRLRPTKSSVPAPCPICTSTLRAVIKVVRRLRRLPLSRVAVRSPMAAKPKLPLTLSTSLMFRVASKARRMNSPAASLKSSDSLACTPVRTVKARSTSL